MAKAKSARTSTGSTTKASNGSTQKSGAKAVQEEPVTLVDEEGDDDQSAGSQDSDEEDEKDMQEGLERLMKALGDDGLTDMDMAHLGIVTGEGADGVVDGEDDEDDDAEDDEDDEEGDEEEKDEEVEDGMDEEDEKEEEEEEEAAAAAPRPSTAAPSKGDSLAASLARSGLIAEEESEEEDDEEEDADNDDELAIPLDSLSDAALAALPESVRAQRMYREKINNQDALLRIRDSIALSGGSNGKASMAWIETLMVPYDKSIQEEVGTDADAAEDDLKRELAFYKQAAHAAVQGKKLAQQANLPFTRPTDFFAEMVKSDEHMERVRQRLLDERAGLKASEDARKQRELKKFGKKVQVEKTLERQRSKRQFEEEVKGMKRKRGGLDGADDGGDDEFDVRLENAMTSNSAGARRGSGAPRGRGRGRDGGPKMPREARTAKFGFGGKKKHAKENTRDSTDDFGGGGGGRGGSSRGRGGFTSRGGRGGASRGRGGSSGASSSRGRPGKARRASGGRG